MNMFKKNGGFTLVELIVVIAILAILAGVAVPAYSGYITKAKDAAVVSELSAVLTAAQAAAVSTTAGSENGGEITAIEITSNSLTVNDGTSNETQLEPFYTQADVAALQGKLSGTSYEHGATWNPTNGWQPKEASGG